MRRKPMQGGGRSNHSNNNGGGHRRHNGGGHHNNNHNRPRKNYPQLREKYLNQAKDALSAGDRVMAEYYFQHADHCYRMMMEEGYRPREQQQATSQEGAVASGAELQESAEDRSVNPSALPTFLTMGYTANAAVANEQQAAAEPHQGQWEEN